MGSVPTPKIAVSIITAPTHIFD